MFFFLLKSIQKKLLYGANAYSSFFRNFSLTAEYMWSSPIFEQKVPNLRHRAPKNNMYYDNKIPQGAIAFPEGFNISIYSLHYGTFYI